jgi:hypothetical protein
MAQAAQTAGPPNNQAPMTIEDRIAGKIDHDTSRALAVSDQAGGLVFANMEQIMEFAKMMSVAGVAVPAHLRAKPGACLGVVMQAVEWRMSPFAVANKSYSVNDRLAYEAQLVHAVVLQRAPIKGRPKVEYTGEAGKRRCRVWVQLRDEDGGETVEYTSPEFEKITPKNSPLWKTDPDQQLFYFSARSLARRHFPDVILGVYARDEIEDARPQHVGPDRARDVTPLAERLAARERPQAGFNADFVHTETGGAPVIDAGAEDPSQIDAADLAVNQDPQNDDAAAPASLGGASEAPAADSAHAAGADTLDDAGQGELLDGDEPPGDAPADPPARGRRR